NNIEYMEQESISSFSSLGDTEPGSKKNSDNKLFVKQSKKYSLTKTIAKKKKHFNENTISTTLSSEVLSDKDSNGCDYNYVSNRHDYGYTTNQYDNDHVTNEHDNKHVTNITDKYNTDYRDSSIPKNGSSINQSTKPNLKDLQLYLLI
ncbi:34584_t:CDS:1, partial [Racocetra persica]